MTVRHKNDRYIGFTWTLNSTGDRVWIRDFYVREQRKIIHSNQHPLKFCQRKIDN